MMLVADESVDFPIVARLRREGHEVAYVAEMTPGASDDLVLSEANQRGAMLVTADKDFGELVYRLGQAHAGVVLLRLDGLSAQVKCERTADAFRNHGPQMNNAFSVVSPAQLRIRPRL